MPKFEVIRPWFGVKAGDVVELDAVNPALESNVRQLSEGVASLEVATPVKAPKKGDIAKRLKELGIEFDGKAATEELAALLPDGDPLKG
ncbi:hypothetical protein WG219_11185 [Ectopseudomonas mendocina]|uniref:HeH/LEM domain-containing protein n=1 Tax=Ectopseudomonas mendocina TaxID=300 RepID=A0ABZ2RFC6_ECTME